MTCRSRTTTTNHRLSFLVWVLWLSVHSTRGGGAFAPFVYSRNSILLDYRIRRIPFLRTASASSSVTTSTSTSFSSSLMNITESPLDLIAPEVHSSSSHLLPMIRTSSLGDIMNSGHIIDDDDSSPNKTLSQIYDMTHPLDRIALTANGNLQRIVASYYDAPVTVRVMQCTLRTTTTNNDQNNHDDHSTHTNADVWDRVVHLCIQDEVVFCVATSVITVQDEQCRNLVASGTVGIGQLFRYLNILPEFHLHDAGKSTIQPSQHQHEYNDGGGGFWRDYTLSCPQLTCRIHEEFIPGLWGIPKSNHITNGQSPS